MTFSSSSVRFLIMRVASLSPSSVSLYFFISSVIFSYWLLIIFLSSVFSSSMRPTFSSQYFLKSLRCCSATTWNSFRTQSLLMLFSIWRRSISACISLTRDSSAWILSLSMAISSFLALASSLSYSMSLSYSAMLCSGCSATCSSCLSRAIQSSFSRRRYPSSSSSSFFSLATSSTRLLSCSSWQLAAWMRSSTTRSEFQFYRLCRSISCRSLRSSSSRNLWLWSFTSASFRKLRLVISIRLFSFSMRSLKSCSMLPIPMRIFIMRPLSSEMVISQVFFISYFSAERRWVSSRSLEFSWSMRKRWPAECLSLSSQSYLSWARSVWWSAASFTFTSSMSWAAVCESQLTRVCRWLFYSSRVYISDLQTLVAICCCLRSSRSSASLVLSRASSCEYQVQKMRWSYVRLASLVWPNSLMRLLNLLRMLSYFQVYLASLCWLRDQTAYNSSYSQSICFYFYRCSFSTTTFTFYSSPSRCSSNFVRLLSYFYRAQRNYYSYPFFYHQN